MVGATGIEPARDFSHNVLSVAWLPLHHAPMICLAEDEGFEPPKALLPCLFSKQML